VHHFVRSLFGSHKIILRDTDRPVTPFGGIAVLVEFLRQTGFAAAVEGAMPFTLESNNAIAPAETFTAFVFSVVTGARRFAHAQMLRADQALHTMLGLERFPGDDTIRNFFRRFNMPQVNRCFDALFGWQLARVPPREGGYTLDLDSTVFERHGRQEGATRGYNPKRSGGAMHHPILAVLAEEPFVIHGWLRSGNARASRGVVEFLRETLARLSGRIRIRCLRADSGFFDGKLMDFLEENSIPYLIVARRTHGIKPLLAALQNWERIDETFSSGEMTVQLQGWSVPRRIIVIRERLREAVSRRQPLLLDVPGYTHRLIVTNRTEDPLTLWRDYNGRASIEERIKELKHDLGADGFCMKKFFSTEAAFRSVLFTFNLLGQFQRACDTKPYRQPATLRSLVFLCGAVLGRSGHHRVLHLSKSWGGLDARKPLFDKLRPTADPTSPKLKPSPA
jgi:hypothetical protein